MSATKTKKKDFVTTEPISKDLHARVADKIIRGRVKLLFQQPFFGTLITRLQIAAADAWLPTMAVDGKYLYYNHRFIDALPQEELEFVFAHEILHMCYDHVGPTGRRGDREPRLYNCACDYVVNNELIKLNIGKFPTGDFAGLKDPKYDNWASEDVYDDLKKQQKNMTPQQMSDALDKMLDQLLDEHMNGSGEGEGDGDPKDGKEGPNGKEFGKGPSQMTDEERRQLREEMKQHIINAAKQAKGRGNIPAGVERMIQELTAPKMDWRSLLQCNLLSLVPADYSFLQVSRKGWDIEPVLPGITNELELELAVAIDTSGSISQEDASCFLSEVKGIMDQYRSYKIQIFCFDTKCYNLQTFSSDDGDDISTYKVVGGGGTDGGAIFRFLKEENINPVKLTVFTDGYVGSWGNEEEHGIPVIWIIKGSDVVPPYGVYSYYDKEQ